MTVRNWRTPALGEPIARAASRAASWYGGASTAFARKGASHRDSSRRGVVVPVVALVLLVLGAIVALVFDRLWLSAARRELQSAADAAALAAAQVLLDDACLAQRMQRWNAAAPPARPEPVPFGPARTQPPAREVSAVRISDALLERARLEAARVAGVNYVAGAPVRLDAAANGDVRFGRLVRRPSGDVLFVQTAYDPTTVVVTAHRTRSRSNPVALLFQGAVGPAAADLRTRSEASFTNRLARLIPGDGVRVPAASFAVPWSQTGGFAVGWLEAIEQGRGEDRWRYDAAEHRVMEGSDGLPELRVRCSIRPDATSVQWLLLDFRNDFSAGRLIEQWREGLDRSDLADWDGVIDLKRWPKTLRALPSCPIDLTNALAESLGERRIAFVFDRFTAAGRTGAGQTHLVGIVGVRLMAVDTLPDSQVEITLQPAVVTTRAADIEPDWLEARGIPELAPDSNRYVFKLMLTH